MVMVMTVTMFVGMLVVVIMTVFMILAVKMLVAHGNNPFLENKAYNELKTLWALRDPEGNSMDSEIMRLQAP